MVTITMPVEAVWFDLLLK